MNDKPLQIRDNRPGYYRIDTIFIKGGWAAAVGVYGLAVYNVLASYANNETQQAYPSYATIARLLGCSRRKVIDAAKQLKTYNLVEVEARTNPAGDQTSNLVTLVSPDEWIRPTGVSDALPGAQDAPPGAPGAPPPSAPDSLPSAPSAPELALTELASVNETRRTEGENTPSSSIAISEKIYRKAANIKKNTSLSPAVMEWLLEQEPYMAVPFQQLALRDTIVEADKAGEKTIFNVTWLEETFADFCNPAIANVNYQFHEGKLIKVNYANLSIQDGVFTGKRWNKVPFSDLTESYQEKATAIATADIARKNPPAPAPEPAPPPAPAWSADITATWSYFEALGRPRGEFVIRMDAVKMLLERGVKPPEAAKIIDLIAKGLDINDATRRIMNGRSDAILREL